LMGSNAAVYSFERTRQNPPINPHRSPFVVTKGDVALGKS